MTPPAFTNGPTLSGDMVVGGAVFALFGATLYDTVDYGWSNGADTGDVGILTLVEGDIGQMITCTVTLSNVDGDTPATTNSWGPIVAAPPPPVTYEPTVADVAALIRARTKDSNGNELGTFTDATRPTDVQCQEAIDHAVILVHQKVGGVGSACSPLARMCAAIGAAAEIELSYFPEQARTDRSPYTYLIQRYEEALDGVLACVLGNLPNADDDDDGVVDPAYGSGTLSVVSGTVEAYYTGRVWPAIPPPAPPPDNG